MKDIKEREQGKYIEVFHKFRDSIMYTKTETIVVGRDFKIMQMSNEYSPGIKYPMSWEQL